MAVVLTSLAVVVIAAAIGALSLHARTRLFPDAHRHGGESSKDWHDITGYATTMVGVFYALIVGLSLVSVWENRDAGAQDSRAEAAGLHEVYLLATSLPPAPRQQIQAEAAAYAHYVETVEWPQMQHGVPLPEAGCWTPLTSLRAAATSYQPTTTAQNLAASAIVTQLGTIDAACIGRQSAANSRMPALLWVGLILGGTLSVLTAFAHSMEWHVRHLTVVMSLTGLIGFTMTLIYVLDNPFIQGFGLGPGPFVAAFPPG